MGGALPPEMGAGMGKMMFKLMDINADGHITKKEIDQFKEKLDKKGPGPRKVPGMADDTEMLFNNMDRDKDGKVTLEEAESVFDMMATMAKDGKIPRPGEL